jgi:hypothetical protein
MMIGIDSKIGTVNVLHFLYLTASTSQNLMYCETFQRTVFVSRTELYPNG